MSAVIDRKKLFGVTHSPDGQRVRREVKFLKVAIGVASQGPDVHVWIAREPVEEGKPWCVEVGSYQQNHRTATQQYFATRAEAESFYMTTRKGAPKCGHPRKLPYFTFLSPGLDGGHIHDFDMIEFYGAQPTELDIVFLNNDPLDEQFRMWSATELLCQGDGINAERKLALATADQQPLVQIARAKGARFFPIIDGCYTKGCPYPKKGQCKPQASLYFQLSRNPLRLGGTVWFDSRGFRSAAQLDDCLYKIRLATGHGDETKGLVAGIPLKLCVRPFKTKYEVNGVAKSGTAFAASIEYRALDAPNLARGLIESAHQFQDALALPAIGETVGAKPAYDESGDDVELTPVELTPEQELLEAAAITAGFSGAGDVYGEGFDEFEDQNPNVSDQQMPRRKSQTTTAETPSSQTATQSQAHQSPAPPLVIAGVTFPEPILAETDEQRMTLDHNTLLMDEAERMGVPLGAYCESLLGLKPSDLTKGAAQALLQVMKKAPTRRK